MLLNRSKIIIYKKNCYWSPEAGALEEPKGLRADPFSFEVNFH